LKIFESKINGVITIAPSVFKDERGYFFEVFNFEKFEKVVQNINFIQDTESLSAYGTLRGMHYQLPPYNQSKLVRVIQGKVLDVALDIRRSSATFGKYVIAELSDSNKHQLFIPSGFAHGFLVLSEFAIFAYKVDNVYNKSSEAAIRWNDPSLAIPWGIPDDKVLLSEKDLNTPLFKEAVVFP
jgi:dTDP-4-dehydrorhamnose 3,5-epimerase